MLQLIRWEGRAQKHRSTEEAGRSIKIHNYHPRKGKGGKGIRTYDLGHSFHIPYPLIYESNYLCNQLNMSWKADFFPSLDKKWAFSQFFLRDGKKSAFDLLFNCFYVRFGLWPNRFDSRLLHRRSRVQISVSIFILSVKKVLVTVT